MILITSLEPNHATPSLTRLGAATVTVAEPSEDTMDLLLQSREIGQLCGISPIAQLTETSQHQVLLPTR